MNLNIKQLVKMSVMGKIHHPISSGNHFRINSNQHTVCVPTIGGISYNIGVGDSVYDIKGDHVEPSVSIRNENAEENNSLMLLSCVGNEAIVVSGEAKGAKGYVLGQHGGIEHTIIEFTLEDKEKMCINDNILIKAYGQGLEIEEFKDKIFVTSLDPNLFSKMGCTISKNKLVVPIVAEIPAYLMGSGIGCSNSYKGDYDLMTTDKNELKILGLDGLKYGDFVLIKDHTNTVGRAYKKGAVTIGVIIHSDSYSQGHGPGITTIMTSDEPYIEGKLDKSANISNYINM